MNFAEEVARYSIIAEEKGLVNSFEGNLSMIDRETGNIYISPAYRTVCFFFVAIIFISAYRILEHSRICPEKLLTPDMICVVNREGEQIGGTGKKSSEFFLHQAAYAARGDIGAVFHCHTPYLTAYALSYRDFKTPEDTFLHQIFGDIQCLPYGEHGTHAIHQGIEKALDGRPVALLGGHGVVCVGRDLENAIGTLEAAENFARTVALKKIVE